MKSASAWPAIGVKTLAGRTRRSAPAEASTPAPRLAVARVKCVAVWLSCLLLSAAIVLSLASPALAQDAPTYIVRPGDTLTRIAYIHGTTVGTLIRLNQARHPCLAVNAACLQAGWVIFVTAPPAGTRLAPTPSPAPATPVKVTPTAAPDSLAGVGQEIIDLTNRNRAANGMPLFSRDERLMEIARWKSQDMATRDYFGHDDPVTGRFLAGDLIFGGEIGNWAGENLAWFDRAHRAATLAASAVQSWMGSPGHRENILRAEYTLIGAGIARSREGWTVAQVFAGP